MSNDLKSILESQFAAAWRMFVECVELCPESHWDELVAKYPFWLVAYHTLYCTDGYLERRETDFKLDPRFHPGGQADIDEEYPSRRFTKAELLEYARHCAEKAKRVFAGETAETLSGDCGFARRNMCRAELHVYNTRHV
ncbi:MAG: DinB family protein, partial [Phycisphaerae bacterium]|nr:DinB family protein [Phycisphaerae bacterium]